MNPVLSSRSVRSAEPRISIVMPFRDPGVHLDRALASLRWQTEENWELIAIDDGSRDGSGGFLRQHDDPRIRLKRHDRSAGLAVRLNEAVALARGRYIARMDADDIAFPQRLQVQADYLDAHPEVDLLASSVLMIDAVDDALCVAVSPVEHAQIVRRAALRFPLPHPTWMGRSEWFRSNPYDERAIKSQDQCLLFRTHRSSRFAAIGEPLLAYRYDRLSLRKTLQGRYHFLRALWGYGTLSQRLTGTSMHALAALRDLLAMASRRDRDVIRRRGGAVPDKLQQEWTRMKERLDAARDGVR
ncbi:glycosyltransferase family 2 protein [Methyloversatilis discipulorum]|uniref:glycosyltransferase family 2 protein n=1 Tax=Methyloversatilis discipulorum TaxID=1119528 RepID=UPI003F2F44D1